MTYIKKLHLEGFKSFAKPTELVFDKGMNVVVGANGSGKSNITDAICFVLGRLKIKSMRAEKAAKLIYNGGKEGKPGQHAKVSVVFDNNDRIFAIPTSEVEISRAVKKDGTSTYKINGETKTRQEILELLAQGGIDPEGFNIILQNEIAGIVEMRSDEKRLLVEDIAGISVYEEKKEKSMRELEKTEDRLKTVKTILNERNAYMKNLEQEKSQAEKYENLKKAITRDKASIIWKNAEKRKKLAGSVENEIGQKGQAIEKIVGKINELKKEIEEYKAKINEIDDKITKKTGIEQEKLRESVLNLRTQLGSLNLKKENFNDQINNITARKAQLEETLKRLGQEIAELEETIEKTGKNGASEKKEEQKKQEAEKISQEMEKLKSKLSEIENKKHKFYILQNEIAKKDAKCSEKENYLYSLNEEINELKRETSELARIMYAKHSAENMNSLLEKKNQNNTLHKKIIQELEMIEKEITHLAARKEIHKKDFDNIISLEKCPTCKQAVSKEHKDGLMSEFETMINEIENNLQIKQKDKEKLAGDIKKVVQAIEKTIEKIQNLESANEIKQDLDRKNESLNKLLERKKSIEQEIETLGFEIIEIKKQLVKPEFIETEGTEYKLKLESLQEKLMRIKADRYEFSDRNYESEMKIKLDEIERVKTIVKNIDKEKIEFEVKTKSIIEDIIKKNKELEKSEKEQEKINSEFKGFLEKKQKLQDMCHECETKINETQTKKIAIESDINELKINRAKINAEIETLELEFREFASIEVVKDMSIDEMDRRLRKNEMEFQQMGAVNLRALEVYDKIKAEYDEIAERVAKLEEEKSEILKIIAEIDNKKKKAFMQTFNAISESFSQNFNMLDEKRREGFLEIENKEDPFEGGLDITIRLAKGKYMDVDALSGGEKVITALALLFAIQKYKPYCFYVFDEIDPALDKRNSDRFAMLLKDNTKNSQGIIITHNDAVMNYADTLYGATMQDGISKIISLKV